MTSLATSLLVRHSATSVGPDVVVTTAGLDWIIGEI